MTKMSTWSCNISAFIKVLTSENINWFLPCTSNKIIFSDSGYNFYSIRLIDPKPQYELFSLFWMICAVIAVQYSNPAHVTQLTFLVSKNQLSQWHS